MSNQLKKIIAVFIITDLIIVYFMTRPLQVDSVDSGYQIQATWFWQSESDARGLANLHCAESNRRASEFEISTTSSSKAGGSTFYRFTCLDQ